MTRTHNRAAATLAAQALHAIDAQTGAVVPGIEPATTFARDADYELRGHFGYAREANPTTEKTEDVLNALSGGEGALLFNAGMSAITAVFETLRPGQHVVAPEIMYHGAQDWLRRLRDTRGIGVTFFNQADPTALAAAMQPGKTALVWIESPVNPTWDVIDITVAAELAHGTGAILGVDATVSPPCTMDAIGLGADIVFQSATKYLGGHSDLTAGALVTAKADSRWAEIRQVRKLTGGNLQPFEAWLLLRGMRTLFVRFERASANALTLA
ncbi:MAG: trans-sulfuration enzyme family protein, partial [Hyphomicrobiaceae bacterium]